MKVCILGSNLSALTLAKALVNQNILLEAKMESMTKDYMDLQQKFDALQSPKRGIKK